MGALVALGTIGLWLWQAAPDRSQAKSNLGTGLLASVVVAAAIGSAQFAIDDRRRDIERTRQTAAQKNADRQNLRLTVGLRKSLVRLDFAGQDLHGFSFAWKDLTQVNFRQARLANAKLSYAILRYADIQRADLRRASLFRAVIDRARLSGANLDGANLQAAQLRWTDLRGGHLRRTTLISACLQYAFLNAADLYGADLRFADLRFANLRGADLRAARLEGALLDSVAVDSKTRWPTGYERGNTQSQERSLACQPKRASQDEGR
jgi:uncharacterized protein YjbI with pentapeptide repeats